MFDNFFTLTFKCVKCSRTVDDGSIIRKMCVDCLDKENPYERRSTEYDRKLDELMYGDKVNRNEK